MTQDLNPKHIAVLGLGVMGTAIAKAMLANGHDVHVWNRTSSRAVETVAAGARPAETAADAVARSSVALICVSDYDAVRMTLAQAEDLLDARTIVNLTSGSSTDARDLAAWVEKRGGRYLDGAILAAPADIGTANSAILLSGHRAGHDLHGETLQTLSPNTVYLGEDPGLSAVHDVAVLAMMWSILNGFLHGAALLKRAGVSAADYLPIAQSGVTTTVGWLAGYAAQIDSGNHPGDDSTVATHVAAMQHLIDETAEAQVDPALPTSFKELGDRAVAAGFADNGYTAIIELLLADRA